MKIDYVNTIIVRHIQIFKKSIKIAMAANNDNYWYGN